jgi:WD40 repeat protein
MNKSFSHLICFTVVLLLIVLVAACQPTLEPVLEATSTSETVVLTPIVELTTVSIPLPSPSPTLTTTQPTTSSFPTITQTPSDPTAVTTQGQILYMLGNESDEYGESKYLEGYVYALTVNEISEPLSEPELFSGSTAIRWGRLHPAPDGRQVLLVTIGFGRSYYLLDPLTGQIRPLFGDRASPDGDFFNWHPNSQQILLWTELSYPDTGLWLVDAPTGNHVALIERGLDMDELFLGGLKGGVVLSNGQVIYSYSGGSNPSIWMIYNSNNNSDPPSELSPCRSTNWQFGGVCVSEPQLLYELSGSGFALSPDGQYIAFYGSDGSVENRGLMIMNADGSNLRLLSRSLLGDYPDSLIWSPDSGTIAFRAFIESKATPQPGIPQAFLGNTIHLIDVDTGVERPLLADGSTGNIDPAWSPDGSQIAFASLRSGTSEIWVVNADGANLRQLTHHNQLARYPVWLEHNTTREK